MPTEKGKHKAFFECESCDNTWFSANTWANTAQQCRECDDWVYPCKQKMTPYQGKRKAFGEFECENCDNTWSSAHTWANTPQQCQECDDWVYPCRQWPLKWSGKKHTKRHLQELCGKCHELGWNCADETEDDISRHLEDLTLD